MSERTDTRKEPLQLVREIESEEKQRRQTRRSFCNHCRDWADAIHIEWAGGFVEER